MRIFGKRDRILIGLTCLIYLSSAAVWGQGEPAGEKPDTSLVPTVSRTVNGEEEKALELRTGGMVSFALYPALKSDEPAAAAINFLLIFSSIRVGPVLEADIPIFTFLRAGPSIGVLYMTMGEAGTGGSIHMFEIPIRFRVTLSFLHFHVTGFAGYGLSGVLAPGGLFSAGLWEIGAQAGIGPLFFEYDMLFAQNPDPTYRQFNAYTRIGAGVTFRLF